MFALLVSGRLVQTNFVQSTEDQRKFMIDIPQAEGVNHVAVFLTGESPFPLGTGGQIYFAWPDSQNKTTWRLAGYISNDKPSTIFKISGHSKSYSDDTKSYFAQPLLTPTPCTQTAKIGILIESLETIKLMSK